MKPDAKPDKEAGQPKWCDACGKSFVGDVFEHIEKEHSDEVSCKEDYMDFEEENICDEE